MKISSGSKATGKHWKRMISGLRRKNSSCAKDTALWLLIYSLVLFGLGIRIHDLTDYDTTSKPPEPAAQTHLST